MKLLFLLFLVTSAVVASDTLAAIIAEWDEWSPEDGAFTHDHSEDESDEVDDEVTSTITITTLVDADKGVTEAPTPSSEAPDAAERADVKTEAARENVADDLTLSSVEPDDVENRAAITDTPVIEETVREQDSDESAESSEETTHPVKKSKGLVVTADGVTVQFVLEATWKVAGSRRRGYTVKIENGSEKDICGLTFTTNSKTTETWSLSVNDDGSLTTKGLRLAPGAASINKFGFASSAPARPSILVVTYC